MAMDLICSANGIEDDSNDEIDIESDLADDDGEDATSAYRQFCVFMALVQKSNFWSNEEKNCKRGDIQKAKGIKWLLQQ
eukprot:12578629-Ditylum_brightwellii.AAC.1